MKKDETWAMPINQNKTKIMLFQRKNQGKKQIKKPSFTLNNYTYLGLEMNQSESLKPAIGALKNKACRTFHAIRRWLYHLKPPGKSLTQNP